MNFELKDVLTLIGTSASLIFASWIFLSLLNERYMSSFERYRILVSQYRDSQEGGEKSLSQGRRDSIREQIFLYKKRCEQMRLAMNLGLTAAICVITGLILGAIQLVFTQLTFLKPISLIGVLGGLTLVIAAATVVMRENLELKKGLDSELADIPDLKNAAA